MTASDAVEESTTTTFGNRPYVDAAEAKVDVYPYGSTVDESLYTAVKTVHYVRHAQGTHNVNKDYRDAINLDARLTETGLEQCQQLAAKIASASTGSPLFDLREKTDLLVSSPLTRCLQTTMCTMQPVLEQTGLRVLALEHIRETVNFNCDRRRTIQEIARDFVERVDFDAVEHDHDHIWAAYEERLGSDMAYPEHRESAELHVVADRGRRFLEWLSKRPESHVVVCSHAAFSRCLWNFGHAGKVPSQVPQRLDQRPIEAKNVPVVRYCGDDNFALSIRQDFDNCELRSMLLAFKE